MLGVEWKVQNELTKKYTDVSLLKFLLICSGGCAFSFMFGLVLL